MDLGPDEPLDQIEDRPDPVWFTEDRLYRASYLVGIYKALHICHSETVANSWVQLPNTNPLCNGITPLEYMIRGVREAMHMVRKLLDARSQGQ